MSDNINSSQSPEIKDIALALSKFQAEITGALKESKNPFFKSSYADLESIWTAIRGPLTKHQLCVIQTTQESTHGMILLTTLAHSSGQWFRGSYPIHPIKNDPQALGSAISYARRYALAAITGIYQTDDDAEGAMSRSKLPGGHTAPLVYPDQPGENDGFTPDHGYRIPFGKWNRRALEDIDIQELRSYVEYIQEKAQKDKKPIAGQVKDFVERATAYIVAFELSPIEQTK